MSIEITDTIKVAQALVLLEYAFECYNDVHNDDNYFNIDLVSKAYDLLDQALQIDTKYLDKLLHEVHHNC